MTAPENDPVVVVIPTYNERANLAEVVGRLLRLPVHDLHVLVVDDDSPDGTGELADELAEQTGHRVEVLHRTVKDGLGRAYVAGMTHALDLGAATVIQMDADLSHPVEVVPLMLATLYGDRDGDGVDVVVGSRYVTGGSTDTAWPWHRRALSRAANAYVDRVLRLRVRDVTSGFKAWRGDALRSLDLDSLDAQGYAFQIEMAYRCRRNALGVTELPIHFTDRARGSSKMTLGVQLEAAVLPWRLRREAHAAAPVTGAGRSVAAAPAGR